MERRWTMEPCWTYNTTINTRASVCKCVGLNDPGKCLTEDGESKNGGEELFVVEGSLLHNGIEYTSWGWLRFPVETDGQDNNQRSQLKAGANGARVYRKTCHLAEDALSKEKIQIKED